MMPKRLTPPCLRALLYAFAAAGFAGCGAGIVSPDPHGQFVAIRTPPTPMPTPPTVQPTRVDPNTKVIEIASNMTGAGAIALSDDTVFWIDAGAPNQHGGRIMRAPKTGGPSTVVADRLARPMALAVDEKRVYFVTMGEVAEPHAVRPRGGVFSVPVAGGHPSALAPPQVGPHSIAIDADSVYFTTSGTEAVPESAVLKVSKRGGPLFAIASEQLHPMHVVVDRAQVFWSECRDPLNGFQFIHAASVTGVPIRGVGMPEGYVAMTGCVDDFVVDDEGIHFVELSFGQVRHVSKGGGLLALEGTQRRGLRFVAGDGENRSPLFFTNQQTGEILRWNGHHGFSVIAIVALPGGIAVDRDFVYFTDTNGGRVLKVARE